MRSSILFTNIIEDDKSVLSEVGGGLSPGQTQDWGQFEWRWVIWRGVGVCQEEGRQLSCD
jgi:hypothetical protein